MAQPWELKRSLLAGRSAFGCWLEMVSPIAAEIIAQAGYDCVMIDREHGPGTVMDTLSLLHAMQGTDCSPLVRVPANDLVETKRILDLGVAGVMIPAVDSKAEAEAAVAACRYPPRGKRGMAVSIIRASGYGAQWQDYAQRADEDLLVICQIESAVAVGHAAEIAAVDGLDMVFIGPFDLSANLGHFGAPDHPQARKAIAEVERATKAAGKLMGGIPTPERSAEDLLGAGYDLILADADSLILRDGAAASVARLRAIFMR